jgi:glycogen debranching enzyme
VTRELPPAAPWIRRLDGPDVVVHADGSVLVSASDGSIEEPEHGLFESDTRLLCHYRLTIDGGRPRTIGSATVDDDRWMAAAIVPLAGGSPEGPALPEDTLEILVERRLGPGLEEQVRFTNRGGTRASPSIRIELASDLLDLLELRRSGAPARPVPSAWDADSSTLTFERAVPGPKRLSRRAVRVQVGSTHQARWDGTALMLGMDLEPGASSSVELSVRPSPAGQAPDGPFGRRRLPADHERRRVERAARRSGRVRIRTQPPLFGQIVDRAIEDLFALRSRDLESAEGAWVLNAGIPRFTGLFGRDVLTAAWQSALAGPEALRGALGAIAATQAQTDDPFRDAEPGKLIHEMRRGPLTESGRSPRDAYYGSDTVPAMFVLALTEAWHWTADDALLEQYLEVAERAMTWAERRHNRDGFLRYQTRSPEGLRNQGWKDSDEAIRYPDGSLVPVPIATVEEQAFHALALERLAEVHLALGRDTDAERELERAAVHRRRWHDAYWRKELGFYALALDPDDRPVDTIASNAGHALGTGIVPAEVARRVADRLFEPDLFSGFGVRTLSSAHPSYNPFAYHLGSVWPVEQATFLLGAKRYGFDDLVARLAEGFVTAAARSPAGRLPEAIAGLDRSVWPIPVPYPGANPLQAWSASATVQVAQTLTGIYPFAPARVVALARPRLPEWLDVIELDGIRVGDGRVSLRFEREADGRTTHQVTDQQGTILVIEAPPPQATDVGLLEGALEWGLEHAPGRLSRVLRIALGIEVEATPAETSVEVPS